MTVLITDQADLARRFWAKVDRRGPDECWLWTAALRNGYGSLQASKGQSPFGAHVASWILHNGPVPKPLFVLHNCPGGDNPRCVNPRHLFVGTQADNMADMRRKGRGAKGEAHGRSKLTEAEALSALAMLGDGRSKNEVAQTFGVCYEAINNLATGRSWGHLDRPTIRDGRKKLTEEAAEEIRGLLRAGRSQREIAAQFGVAQSQISNIKHGITWRRVE